MKKILMISYVSKEIDGRPKRHYCILCKNQDIELSLIQACRSKQEYSVEKNVINIDISSKERGIKQFLHFKRAVKQLIREKEYDYLFLLNYYSATFYRYRSGAKVIYDAFELYYPGCRSNFSLRDRFFYLEEKKAIKHADTIIAANRERALIMVGLFRLKKVPEVVSNNPLNKVVNLSYEKKNDAIVYAGYLNKEREIEKLIDAVLKYNLLSDKPIGLHIYGVGELEQLIKEKAKLDSNIRYLGGYKNDDLNRILIQYKYGYIAYENSEMNTRFCSPNKLFDYIFNDIVIISNDNNSLCEFIKTHAIGTYGSDFYESITRAVNNYQQFFDNVRQLRLSYEPTDEYRVFDSIFN